MKAVILAGGHGTRLGDRRRPKPLCEIGGRPLISHILRGYEAHGITDFVICGGYRIEAFHDWLGTPAGTHEATVELPPGEAGGATPWRITLVDTGLHTRTGGRLARVRDHLDSTFCLTYGDGLADVDITAAIRRHRETGATVTVTAVHPPEPFGVLDLPEDDDRVVGFAEKPGRRERDWVNGGFFVVEPHALELIDGDDTAWEREPLSRLAARGELVAHRHEGFWHPVDTPADHEALAGLWADGAAPWKVW